MKIQKELNINSSDIVVCECISKNNKTYYAICLKYNNEYIFLNYTNAKIFKK